MTNDNEVSGAWVRYSKREMSTTGDKHSGARARGEAGRRRSQPAAGEEQSRPGHPNTF